MSTDRAKRAKVSAAIAVTIAAMAGGAPAASANAAGVRDPSPEQLCPPWYGDVNPAIGCTPHAISWLGAHDPMMRVM